MDNSIKEHSNYKQTYLNYKQKYLNYKKFLSIKDIAVAIRITVVHDFYELNEDNNYEVDQYIILGSLNEDSLNDIIDQLPITPKMPDIDIDSCQVSNLLNSNCISTKLLDKYTNNNNIEDIYVSSIIPGNSSAPSYSHNQKHSKQIKVIVRAFSGEEII